ncbi:fibroblast growth factor 1-like [Actinia tenebrosa]|uniref:Fibroblast growth factor n=1 Tax=Actinia tenebrosa TaxID=6105 RepID=A0A6P8HEG7_ACTTE|nr:fibroblast growth factor 1-like [Actinia tenebrosa]
MELAIIKFMCLSVLMGLQMVTSSSKVIKKIDSHIAKQATTKGVLRHRPTTPAKPQHNESDWTRISRHPTNYAIVKMYSRTGYFLEIPSSRKIQGTKHRHSKFANLIMESVGKSIVRFKGQLAQKYLAMNAYGILYATQTLNDECLFKEKLEESGFHTFSSNEYSGSNSNNQNKELYVAIKKNGKAKHGVNTAKRQRAVQFIVLRIFR